ncbi:MAG: 16S rRNA (cytosine(1402)-N(4))-methyltransferase RsmH [Peptococcaceae bacterium]|nr:16S rRNA (cytosine(1402)-N(4))-methyltransferase RsmH [Peptococcaceae bacterium]
MPDEDDRYLNYHRPVLLEEIIDVLKPQSGGVYVDCTLGGAGHTYHLLEASSPRGKVVGIDQDTDAINAATERLKDFSDRAFLVKGNFTDLPAILNRLGIEVVDGILYDLGVSSYQLDNPDRGFSYKKDALLDMRMDRSKEKTAEDLVNNLSQDELANIISKYGEERFAGRIAFFICRERENTRITTTGQLVEIIKQAIPARYRRVGPHPAKRTFQALRIEVNGELDVLVTALEGMIDCLKPGGRVAVITYHSLEDRIVKDFFKRKSQGCQCSKEFPVCVCTVKPSIRLIKAGGVTPSAEEIEGNPRARSARLRVAQRL